MAGRSSPSPLVRVVVVAGALPVMLRNRRIDPALNPPRRDAPQQGAHYIGIQRIFADPCEVFAGA